jgi:predicted nucleic acid-binding protein
VIFVDTSFWVALTSARDDRHRDARALLERFGGASLVTSNHVRGETWTFLRRRHGHGTALAFLDRLERSRLASVRFVTEQLEVEALSWLRHHDEREYSFVDATSFALMRSLRMREALAFDVHFGVAGFETLRARER